MSKCPYYPYSPLFFSGTVKRARENILPRENASRELAEGNFASARENCFPRNALVRGTPQPQSLKVPTSVRKAFFLFSRGNHSFVFRFVQTGKRMHSDDFLKFRIKHDDHKCLMPDAVIHV